MKFKFGEMPQADTWVTRSMVHQMSPVEIYNRQDLNTLCDHELNRLNREQTAEECLGMQQVL